LSEGYVAPTGALARPSGRAPIVRILIAEPFLTVGLVPRQHIFQTISSRDADFAESPIEKSPFTLIRDQTKRLFIALGRGGAFAFAPEQVRARGINQMVIFKLPRAD
jgi:hypothetical protein